MQESVCQVLEFPGDMAKKTSPEAVASAPVPPMPFYRTPVFGAIIGSIISAIVVSAIFLYGRSSAHAEQDFGLRVDQRIDTKLGPINSNLTDLGRQIGVLQGQVSFLQGFFARQAGVSAILSGRPDAILARVTEQVRSAQSSKKIIPAAQFSAFRNAVLAIHPSSSDYWQTVATLINYQSFVLQKLGHAPDPEKVSRPCALMTAPNSHNNSIEGETISGCIADIDENSFKNVTFVNSVIRYSGGPPQISNVRFVNCRFIVTTQHLVPEGAKVLYAILDAENPSQITINPA